MCFNNTLFVFIIAFPSALSVPYFLHRTGVLRTFCPNVLRTFRPNIFYCLSKKGVFQQTRFCILLCISVSTFVTVFFAPYRRFAYILPECFACISSKHFLLFIEKRRVSTTRFLFLLSHIRQHFWYRIFCTVQAFCVHFVPIYIVFPRKKRVGLRHALFIIFAVSANSDTVLPSGGNPSYLKAFFCKTFPLFVQCQIIMVREMRFFCKSTPSTFTSTTSPTFTTSNGCLTNFLAES